MRRDVGIELDHAGEDRASGGSAQCEHGARESVRLQRGGDRMARCSRGGGGRWASL